MINDLIETWWNIWPLPSTELRKAIEVIEHLIAERDNLIAQRTAETTEFARLVDHCKAECDALAKDAARYRWIVKNTDCSFGLATFQLDVPHPSYALDVCIDTAIAKEQS